MSAGYGLDDGAHAEGGGAYTSIFPSVSRTTRLGSGPGGTGSSWVSSSPVTANAVAWQGHCSLRPGASSRSRQPWWVQVPDTAFTWPSLRRTNPATPPTSNGCTAPSGRSVLDATALHVPV